MAIIKIKEIVTGKVTKGGKPYAIVNDEAGQKYFVWEQNLGLLNGLQAGDEVDITTSSRGQSMQIDALTKVGQFEDIPDEDDYPEEFDIDEDDIPDDYDEPAPPSQPAPAPAEAPKVAPAAARKQSVAPKAPAAAPVTPTPAAPATKTQTAKTPSAASTETSAAAEAKPASTKSVAPAATSNVPLPPQIPTGEYEPDEDTSDSPNLEIYNKVRSVPSSAKKDFLRGSFEGTDINPQWRIKKLTELFGPVGHGWKYTVDKQWTETAGNIIGAFVNISLYYRDVESGEWSDAILGNGGSVLYSPEGFNDEAYKMAETDAFGKACQKLGIGADVYWAAGSTKYSAFHTKQ